LAAYDGANWYTYPKALRSADIAWDPADLAPGASTTQTITVTGAVLGDFAFAVCGASITGLTLTAYVNNTDQVTMVLANNTAGNVNIGNNTFRAMVLKQ
jgi:hypothetical protein